MQFNYSVKEQNYFGHIRTDLLKLAGDVTGKNILELGAGTGNTLLHLKHNCGAARVTGIELMPIPGSNQTNPSLDAFFIADAEQHFPPLPLESFDLIICADVLKHLRDPWAMVRHLTTLLRPEGRILVSVPNLREISTLWQLVVRGDFAYAPHGIMDQTHLRFFCRKNAIALVQQAGLKVDGVYDSLDVQPERAGNRPFLNKLTLGLLRGFWPVQTYVIGKRV